MTEYWKSNARKFCDFCKCWLTDNKISISYHENGKKHKENVQNHISKLTKKSAKDHKQQLKIDDEMKKMEKAAMAAYLKDVQNNADLSSQELLNLLDKKNSDGPSTEIQPTPPPPPPPPSWQEVLSDDGNVYYWNKETNDTTWEPPENYVSLADQKKQENKKNVVKEKVHKHKQAETVDELKAFMNREKMKKFAVKNTEPSKEENPVSLLQPICGPAMRSNPYGKWTAIPERIEDEKIDLQLPVKNKINIEPPVVVMPETVQFKEKKVQSLGEGIVDFKKRKFSAKKNMRKKEQDDD